MRARKAELSKQTRKQLYMKRKRAQLRMQKCMEDYGELSIANVYERLATREIKAEPGRRKKIMESTDVAISKMVNERSVEEFSKDHENLSDTKNITQVKLEFETEEEMEERLACENHVKIENMAPLKVEPVDDD